MENCSRPSNTTPDDCRQAGAEQLATFLAELFSDDDLIEIRPIETWQDGSGKRSKPLHAERRWVTQAAVVGLAEHLAALTDAPTHANIFFGVCPRPAQGKGKAADVRVVRCVWADLDDCQPHEAMFAVRDAELLEPSIVVDSGHGTHLYWVLDPPVEIVSPEDRERVEGIVGRINARIGGDHVKDLARLLRLPGFLNVKNARNGTVPVPCRLVSLSGNRYELDQIKECLPEKNAPDEPLPSTEPEPVEQELTPEVEAWVRDRLTKHTDDRSDRDFGVVCDLIRAGWGKDAVRRLVGRHSKFAERDSDYFEPTWEAASKRVAEEPNGHTGNAPSASSKPVGITFGELLTGLGSHIELGTPIIQTVPCGWLLLDETVGGLVRGEYLGLIGGPGVGKSTLADQLVIGALRANPEARAIIFALETASPVRAARLLAAHCIQVDKSAAIVGVVPIRALLRGELRETGRMRALAGIQELIAEFGSRLRIVDDVNSASGIGAIIQSERPDVVLIDHLGLVLADSEAESETARMDSMLVRLIGSIRASGTAAIIINEVNKVALGTPDKLDLAASRGSARFGSLAAVFVGLTRTPPRPGERDPEITAIVVKSRFGPRDKRQSARFFGGLSYFDWWKVESITDDETASRRRSGRVSGNGSGHTAGDRQDREASEAARQDDGEVQAHESVLEGPDHG